MTPPAQVVNDADTPIRTMPALLPTPLHTRMISIRLGWGDAGEVVVFGRIVDLRKRGLVPLVGKLQGPGIVHDMSVRLRLRGDDLTIVAIDPQMAAYPFAAAAATRNEACPQILPGVQSLVGSTLADGYDSGLVSSIGGPRGCFHVFTLLRLLGPAVVSAMSRERERRKAAGRRQTAAAAGSPIFARSLIVDGLHGQGMRLTLHANLFDLDYVLGAETLPIEEEMASSFEAIAEVEVELPNLTVVDSSLRTRSGGASIATPGAWRDEPIASRIVDLTMYKGYTAEVQRIFAETAANTQTQTAPGAEIEAMQHVLFMLAPAMLQCMPSLFDEIEWRPRRAEGSRGAVDSCHMWRADGPLMQR